MNASNIDTLVFGGSFDPIHHGHLIVARHVAEASEASRVLLVPAAANPLKGSTVASGPQRLAMCRLATAGDPLFEVSDVEVTREPPSYTIDTLEALQRQGSWGRLGVMMGADMLSELHKWHRVKDLVSTAHIVVVPRPPRTVDEVHRDLNALGERLGKDAVEQLKAGVVAGPMLDISATQIRTRMAEKRPICYLTAPSVVAFIEECGLYTTGT
jgi:nicotinate-nucleotide adenylyltransferase